MAALTFPNESPEYRSARNDLLQKEIELRRAVEAVAVARRALPVGGELPEDYVFEEVVGGKKRQVRLSELFDDKPTLAIYSYMFGPDVQRPCRMCTPLLDGLDGTEDHIRQRLRLVIVAESPAERLRAWCDERGWKRLRLVSAAGSGYNRAYHGKGDKGGDTTMLNVFRRDGDAVRHFWGTEMAHDDGDPGQHHRGLDFVNPIFNMLDATPEGRGDFLTKLHYG